MPVASIDEFDPPPDATRQYRPSIEAEAALQDSIAERGVLIPVLVNRIANRLVIIDGDRRLRAARAAGLVELPYEIYEPTDSRTVSAAAAAANMVRLPFHPLDEWRHVVQLQAQGSSLLETARTLGLSERRARQLDRLGRLHPDIHALIEKWGMPQTEYLARISGAAPAAQAKAAKAKHLVLQGWGNRAPSFAWHELAAACRKDTLKIPRGRAIFDIEAAGLVFDQDIFAEPGSDDEFTTTDVRGFIREQLAAVKADVAARLKKKERVQLIAGNADGGADLPKGWKRSHGDVDKPKRTETVFTWLDDYGTVHRATAVDAAEEKRRDKEREKAKKGKAAAAAKTHPADAGDAAADDAPDDAPAPEPAEPEEPKAPFTKAGQAAIAAAKTKALRARLRNVEFRPHTSLPQLIGMLVLALHAKNVQIHGYDADYRSGGYKGEDLMRRLVSPDGHCAVTETTVVQAACEALARTLSIDPPDAIRGGYRTSSGEVAEWIGFAAHADLALPRFDTLEILATVNGAELRRLAQSQGIKLTSVGELRKRLAGQLPDWRPAEFGAPGPTPAKVSAADMGNGDGEEEAA